MNTTFRLQEGSEIIFGGYCMDFMSFGNKGLNKAHPEVIDIPGGIQYHCNFHGALIVRILLPLTSGYLAKTEVNSNFLTFEYNKYT
jgi:hypothetical protein